MADLSADQLDLKASINKSATIWGSVVGLIVAAIAWFVLGSLDMPMRAIGALVIGGAAGFGIYRWQFGAQSKSAQCGKCHAAFSITRTDRKETEAGREDKVERKPQDDGSTEVTRFTEVKFDVVDTYTCASCGDVTTREYQTTRRENVQTKIDPAPAPEADTAPAAAVSAAKGAAAPSTGDAPAPKAPSGGLGRGGSSSQ